MGGEDHFGRCRGKAASVVGLSGLDDHWMSLGGTRNIEGPLHLEVLAAMIGEMDFLRIEEAPGFAIANEGIVLETVGRPGGRRRDEPIQWAGESDRSGPASIRHDDSPRESSDH